jgi:hypothetical protein
MRGAIPPPTQHVFMAWCLVKHRDNFTFTLTKTTPLIEQASSYLFSRSRFRFNTEIGYREVPRLLKHVRIGTHNRPRPLPSNHFESSSPSMI